MAGAGKVLVHISDNFQESWVMPEYCRRNTRVIRFYLGQGFQQFLSPLSVLFGPSDHLVGGKPSVPDCLIARRPEIRVRVSQILSERAAHIASAGGWHLCVAYARSLGRATGLLLVIRFS